MTTTGPYPQLPQRQSKLGQVKDNQPSKPVLSPSQTELSASFSLQMGTANPATLQPARSLLITSITCTFLIHMEHKKLRCSYWQAQPLSHGLHSSPMAMLPCSPWAGWAKLWEAPIRVQTGTRAPESVGKQPPAAPQTKLLHAARFVPCHSTAQPLVFLKITILSMNNLLLERLQYNKCTGREISDADGCRKEARKRQAGMKRSSSVLSHRRGKETPQNGRKDCLGSFPSHNPQHNLQCS